MGLNYEGLIFPHIECGIVTPLDNSLTSQVAPVFILMFMVFGAVLLLAWILGRKEEKKKEERAMPILSKKFPRHP